MQSKRLPRSERFCKIHPPLNRQFVRLCKIAEGVGLGKAIHRIAFMQAHVLTCPRGYTGQQGTPTIHLYEDAFTHRHDSANPPLDLVLDGNPREIASGQGDVSRPYGHLSHAIGSQVGAEGESQLGSVGLGKRAARLNIV